ncbi:MAG TPA: alkaline phosphatase PhoX [Planctomycetota bacterium]|nr:alkaline phosphatase PhoX [Planctomycetota bacterium]
MARGDSPSRRHFLRTTAAVGAAFLGLKQLVGCSSYAPAYAFEPLEGMVRDPNNVLHLRAGFTYRMFSRTGEKMDDGFLVPASHDGMAAFPGPDGTTILVRNHELTPQELRLGGPFGPKQQLLKNVPDGKIFDAGKRKMPGLGGTTTLVYDTKGQMLERHFLSLAGTWRNCAGGPTPWGSWVTCEESVQCAKDDYERDHGWCFEVPASAKGLVDPVPLKAMGRFNHEAIAVDPKSGAVYLTEDRGDPRDYLPEEYVGGTKPVPKPEDLGAGLFYRFLPSVPGQLARGGRLQALRIKDKPGCFTGNWSGERIAVGQSLDVEWMDLDEVESPKDDLRHRGRAAGAAAFERGEGIWTGKDGIYFTCTTGGPALKGQVWRYVPSPDEGTPGEAARPGRLELFLEPNDRSLMENCDNLTIAPWGDLFLCEDGPLGNSVVGVTLQGRIYRIAQVGMNRSELCGCCLSPDGSTLFVNLQRPGITVAITGPFRKLSSDTAVRG